MHATNLRYHGVRVLTMPGLRSRVPFVFEETGFEWTLLHTFCSKFAKGSSVTSLWLLSLARLTVCEV